MTSQNSNHENRQKLWELLKEVRFTMISHQTENNEIHAQPMTMLNSDKLNEHENLYFLLKDTNDIVKALSAGRSNLGLTFSKPSNDTYISISAEGHITTDRTLIETLWNPWAENWFDGKDDPSVRVLVAKAISAEYWDVKDNKVTSLFKVLKANVTGETQEPDTDHQKLDL
ncbi:general stress protein [Acinetobacter sp. NCu2D-2]|uniref:pyridoxamine 5'-phosphate oxidase family protein n=1 Tax=Acinetobacter sp. NCu2D-2 TaxID=1608473 RepID=UPI0007CDA45F|nr:pyridoxamine 5'-phosphate oxidase family protein [Acinetobacter sp. NCu2D-2]ANF81905.1 general stress protein [Acinetobacter sp. NCu2D-2]